VGPMIIYGPHNSEYDVDLGPIMLSDWYHTDYFSLVEQTMAPISAGLPPPISQNNLINGKMNYPCDAVTTPVSGFNCTPNAGISKFNVTSGLTYRLRLINSGAEGMQKFSIDGRLSRITCDLQSTNAQQQVLNLQSSPTISYRFNRTTSMLSLLELAKEA